MPTLKEKADKVKREFTNQVTGNQELKPVTTVAKLTAICQQLFPTDREALLITQEAYKTLLVSRGSDLNQARQSWVTASGGNFEVYLRNHLNEVINSKGLVAIKGTKLKSLAKSSANLKKLVEFLTLPNKRRCTQTNVDVWPDNDILVLCLMPDQTWRVLASISAKTSSHSRNTSVLFWALAITPLGIKYFLATQDRDNQFVKPCTSTDVNQERRLFEAYCDRVFTSNPDASYCSQVKSLLIKEDGTSELTDELLELMRITNGLDYSPAVTISDLERY